MATDLTAADLALFNADQIAFHEQMRLMGYYGTPVNAVEASVSLTLAAQATAGDTMTIGNKMYTYVASGANEDGEINIGADKAATQTNTKAAINGTDGYNVAHTQVVCGTLAGDVYPITAKVAGTAAHSILCSETYTSGSNVFSHDHLQSGVDGTIGIHGVPMIDTTYLYFAVADNGVADKNWRRVALGSAF